jgi:inhibitor of cysteine peptidase
MSRIKYWKESRNMKTRIMMVFAVLAVSLFLVNCAPVSTLKSMEVSCDTFSAQSHVTKQAEVGVGDTFTVALCSNASTGFSWSEAARISDSKVVQQVEHKVIPPGQTGLVGAAGQEAWTFKALKQGTSTISMEYGRPWEGGEKGQWTFELAVSVK